MKPVNELIDQTKSQIGNSQPEGEKKQSGGIINLIFHNLKLIFPAWRQNFKTEIEFNLTKNLWLETLIDENITTQEEITRALKRARCHDSAFFPSIGQFIEWTKKEASRVNEDAYKLYKPRIMPHTQEEYEEMGKRGIERLREKI